MESNKYVAFISYSHDDERWGRWVHRALEDYRLPPRLAGQTTSRGEVPRRLTPIFRDRDELPGANDLGEKLEAALAASANLIVICSPTAARSRWVNEEIRTYQKLGRGQQILSLIVDGEPGDPERECFPEALRFAVDEHGRRTGRRAEPIAADLRPGMDGKSDAKLKLVAGMLDLGLDDLKQREQARQIRRLAYTAAAATAGMVLTATLAISAWIARQDAVRSRNDAEDLIGFMIGDLRNQLEPVGRLDVLRSVGDKAMSYFRGLEQRDVTESTLLRRAEALRQIGDVRLTLGDFEEAAGSFERALALSQGLSDRDPDNPDWLNALGNAWFWVGYVAWERGELEASVVPMQEYLSITERLLALDPARPEWRLEHAYALANLGSLDWARGESTSALTRFGQSNQIVAGVRPDAAVWFDVLETQMDNFSWIAKIQRFNGELDQASTQMGRAVDMAVTWSERYPDDRRIHAEEATYRTYYADGRRAVGDLRSAHLAFATAVDRWRELVEHDPANTDWRWGLARALKGQSEAYRAEGRWDEALTAAQESREVAGELLLLEPESKLWMLAQLSSDNVIADCHLAAGRHEDALEILTPTVKLDPDSIPGSTHEVDYARILARAKYLAARGHAAADDHERAEQLRLSGLGLLDPDETEPFYRATRAMLLAALGRSGEARVQVDLLIRQGFAEPAYLEIFARIPAG